jgi:hypothetical protein
LETYSSHHHVDVVGVSPRADIDMNQIPSETTDCDEAVVSSPTVSTICMKREREKLHVFDHLEQVDRGFDLCTRGGGSDDEDGTTRKKLRLSKEQSALLEESFKDHSTLNPKQKSALAKQLNLSPRQVEVWFQNRRARYVRPTLLLCQRTAQTFATLNAWLEGSNWKTDGSSQLPHHGYQKWLLILSN